MSTITTEDVKRIVRQVRRELGGPDTPKSTGNPGSGEDAGPRVLMVFHAGVRKLETALEQTRIIEEMAGKSGVFTGDSARRWVCGADVKEQAGARCILDTVRPDGLEKVLERADILVLPTFCLRVAAKVASLTCDNEESMLVLRALLLGKKALASRDGFMICDILTNENIRKEIDGIFGKLEGFGMTFCSTEELSRVFKEMTASTGKAKKAVPPERVSQEGEAAPEYRLITAKIVNAAVDNKETTIWLAPEGKVTPLARDLAKEYSIKIIERQG